MQFKQGEKFSKLYFDDEQSIEVGRDCSLIVVEMENGQMAGVPWFEVYQDGLMISKWNAALVQGVAP